MCRYIPDVSSSIFKVVQQIADMQAQAKALGEAIEPPSKRRKTTAADAEQHASVVARVSSLLHSAFPAASY